MAGLVTQGIKFKKGKTGLPSTKYYHLRGSYYYENGYRMHQEKSPKFCLLLKHDKKDIVVRLLGHLSILIPSFKYAMSVDMPAKVSTALIDKCIHNLRNEKSFKAKLFVCMMPRVI